MTPWYFKMVLPGNSLETVFGERYIVIRKPGKDDTGIAVVKAERYDRWLQLKAWHKNGVYKDTPAWENNDNERQMYETLISYAVLEPADEVLFVTPEHKEKFRVKSGNMVLLNNCPKEAGMMQFSYAVYIDPTHLYLGSPGKWNRFQVCELAEFCERNGINIEPVQS